MQYAAETRAAMEEEGGGEDGPGTEDGRLRRRRPVNRFIGKNFVFDGRLSERVRHTPREPDTAAALPFGTVCSAVFTCCAATGRGLTAPKSPLGVWVGVCVCVCAPRCSPAAQRQALRPGV